jgi:hypothetical protein
MNRRKLRNQAENAAEVRITATTILRLIGETEIDADPPLDLAALNIDKNIKMVWIGTVMIGRRGETGTDMNAGRDETRMMMTISVDHQLRKLMINPSFTRPMMAASPA